MVIALKAMEGLTFGADPELFVVDTNGDFVSAEGLIPGTKDKPYKVDCGAVQVDGMAAEFNIDPVDNYVDFRHNMKTVRQQLKKMLPKGYKLVEVATAEFKPEVWNNTPDHAKMLGCSPDFNAWNTCINKPPKDREFIRHAGGHLHIGWTDEADTSDTVYASACLDLVRQLDWYLGTWSTLKDTDAERREMYGKAGSMRFKPYGVEYRTLSNFWLKSDALMLETWNRMQAAIWGMKDNHFPVQYSRYNNSVISSINTSVQDNTLFSLFDYPIRHYG
jgi:hypothetical protein